MSHSFSFAKVHGLGNDFVLIRGELEEYPWLLDVAEVARVCDRHRGIGADGVLLVSRAGVPARMQVFNADGSRPEMCGNGLRCVAQLLLHENGGSSMSIATDAGPHECELSTDNTIRVRMRDPDREGVGETTFPDVSGAILWSQVNVGNPHVVTFATLAANEKKALAPRIEAHETFPARINVNFAQVLTRNKIELSVFERGVGWTDACGTGACASVVAATRTHRVDLGCEIEVRLPGGSLWIQYDQETNKLWMRGPAQHVFQGAR